MTVADSKPPHSSTHPSDSASDISSGPRSPVNEKNIPVDQYETPMDEDADRKADKALLWKIDRTLVPFMTLLFLMSFLDRINIGVAKLAGLTEELHLSSAEFNIASMVFFVSYVAFEIPSNLILKKARPSRWIPAVMLCWGIVQTFMGLVKTYEQLVACRILLGLFECGLFPGLSFFLSSWYKRRELNLRISLFFSAATLAGALGGILGYGFSQMDGIGGLRGFSWIFICEGLITVVIACISPWFVHDFPDKARFLNTEERSRVIHRLQVDTGVSAVAIFSWDRVLDALKDYKTWLFMCIYIGCAEPIYSQSLFAPTIIAALGKWSRPQSLLLSVPPYALAFCTTIATAILSDRWGHRGYFLMFWSSISVIGYIILMTVPISQPGVLYFAIFLSVSAIAPCIATTISWTGNNFLNHYKKATAMGMVFTFGNSGGIIASNIYRSQDSPRFRLGHGITLGFSVLCLVCSITVHFLMKRENERRDRIYGPPPPPLAKGEVYDDETLQRLGLYGKSEEEIIAMGDKRSDFRYIL